MLVSLRSHDTCVNRYSGSRGRGRRSAAYLFVDVAPVAAKMESKPGRCYHPLVHRLPPRRLPPFANLRPPPPGTCIRVTEPGYSAGIPDTEAKGNDVFAKGNDIDVISHVIPV